MSNNKVTLSGELLSNFIFNHSYKNKNFVLNEIKVKNQNNKYDIIKIICSENLIENQKYSKGDFVCVEGEFHSYNDTQNNKSHLLLFCFVKSISNFEEYKNTIYINGFICKIPTLRTIHSNLKICDMLVAVNRNFKKSDYLPCVSYNSLTNTTISKKVGDEITFEGMIQSRNYIKKFSDYNIEKKIAYEIVIKNLIK